MWLSLQLFMLRIFCRHLSNITHSVINVAREMEIYFWCTSCLQVDKWQEVRHSYAYTISPHTQPLPWLSVDIYVWRNKENNEQNNLGYINNRKGLFWSCKGPVCWHSYERLSTGNIITQSHNCLLLRRQMWFRKRACWPATFTFCEASFE